MEWHQLSAESAKTLVMLWLIAAESNDGELPSTKELAFRLRVSIKSLETALSQLDHWLISDRYQDDINLISKLGVKVLGETETETETEIEKEKPLSKEKTLDEFAIFWQAYPRKEAKTDAIKAWSSPKFVGRLETILAALKTKQASGDWVEKKYIPLPASWLRGCRWEDQIGGTESGVVIPIKVSPCCICNSRGVIQVGRYGFCADHLKESEEELFNVSKQG